jgi:hypothetical protein
VGWFASSSADIIAVSTRRYDMTFKQIGIDIGKSTFHVVALNAAGDIAMACPH